MLNHTTTASYYNVFKCISMVYFKARDCVNKEVGEGCPGEETQLQHCQERSCPGEKGLLMLVWNPYKSLG